LAFKGYEEIGKRQDDGVGRSRTATFSFQPTFSTDCSRLGHPTAGVRSRACGLGQKQRCTGR